MKRLRHQNRRKNGMSPNVTIHVTTADNNLALAA